jgi:hypothetical protein
MRKIMLATLAGLALISCGCLTGSSMADEAPIVRSKKVRAACHGPHCGGPYSSCAGGRCRTVCPYARGEARYSPCYPLYGAYGPIGGTGYWGAYTYSGWGPSW